MAIQSTDLYIRQCQECGHRQESKPCIEYKGDSWRDTKCKKCRSSGLDYGSFGWNRVIGDDHKFYREPCDQDGDLE